MKSLAAFLLLAVAPVFGAETGQMSDTERAFLVDQLEQTKKQVLDSIAGLTPEQWRFKAAPDRWSVAECAEHIILAEGLLFGTSQKILQSPAVDRLATSNSEVDQKLVVGVTDRSHKLTAPEPLVPSGKIASPAEAAAAFTEARDKSIAYVKTTHDELRTHVGQGPVGPMDAYQFLILMSSHSARHTAQIREVEASAGYPKANATVNMNSVPRRAGSF